MGYSDWLRNRAALSPNRTAFVDSGSGRQWTFADFNGDVNRTAAYLVKEHGIAKGDVVAVLAGNSYEYIVVWFALGRLGAILQNLNWRLAPESLTAIVADGAPKMIIAGDEYIEQAALLQKQVPSILVSLYLNGREGSDSPYTLDASIDDAHVFPAADFFPPEPVTWDDPWVICYTGGTTGLPKGAILTHRNITFNAINTVTGWELTAADRAILNAPLFHTGALNVFTAPLIYGGGSSIICKIFEPAEVFRLIIENEVTVFFGVPTMFIMLQEHELWTEADFSRLKLVISGGAPCPLPVFERFWAKDVDFKTGYGLTEAGPNNFWLPKGLVRQKPGHVGFPLPHVEIQLRDENNRIINGAGTAGEVCINGPHVTPGYWHNQAATIAAIDNGGWLHTGDLAVRDEDGSYQIVGRLKDIIISGGENIYPAEVESVMHEHPAVAEAVLLGVPHDKWGEVGRAVLVPHSGSNIDTEEFISYLKPRLAGYKIPKSVVITHSVPKTAAGKIDRKKMQKQFVAEWSTQSV